MRIAKYSFESLIVAATIGLAAFGAAAVSAAPTGGIGGRPANPDSDNPRTQSIFINTLDRGDSTKDTVLITNNSDQTRTIELYAVDGMVTNTGAYTCKQQSESHVASGAWIKLSEDEVTLPAGEDIEVPFTISVPDNADVGEHNACLVFADAQSEGEAQGSLRIHTRQAVRVVTTIPGDLHRKVGLSEFTVDTQKRAPQFSLTVNNQGNVSADVNVQLRLKSLFDNDHYANGGVYPVFSNEELQLNFEDENPPFWGGWYRALLSVEYNTDAASLGFDAAADKAETITREQTIFIRPAWEALVIIGVAVAALLGVIVYIVAQRARANARRRQWQVYIVREGDTVETLAQASGVAWKQLAKINRLVAPYALKPGQKLKLPATAKLSQPKTATTPAQSASKPKSSQPQKRPLSGDIRKVPKK